MRLLGSDPRRGSALRASSATKGRLRLFVVQALVLSLFVTLFARLWYMQVLGGEAYQAQAAEQSVRELVVQPARGLIVDDMGRPLVANRTSWVVSLDRTHAAQDVRHRAADAAAAALQGRPDVGGPRSGPGPCSAGSRARSRGPAGTARPTSRCRSPRTSASRSPSRSWSRARTSRRCSSSRQSVRAYPSPYGINAAHLLGYLSPITSDELDEAKSQGDTSVHGASVVGRAGLEKEYDRYLRGRPGYKRVAVDSMGRVLGDSGQVDGRAGDTVVTSIDARVQGVVEQQLAQTIKTARQTFDKVTGRNYVADSGSVVVLDAKNGRVVAMAGAPTYDPKVWVGGITSKQLKHLYSAKARLPAAVPGHPGPVRPGRRGSRS